jgi:endonuclease YncB( thermonuclease family)
MRALLLALALALAGPSAARGESWDGVVVSVRDGDTLDVRVGGETRRVRIAGIDTPERGQPWSDRARRALADRVAGREVRIHDIGRDRYGRTLGEVYADGVCVGCELVREGHAWVYRGASDDEVLHRLEAEARAQRRGLWALPESQRVPPWEWRSAHPREPGPAPPAAAPSGGAERGAADPACDSARGCAEMTSCEQARFHLRRCGRRDLDGDGDGVPCEALCRGAR